MARLTSFHPVPSTRVVSYSVLLALGFSMAACPAEPDPDAPHLAPVTEGLPEGLLSVWGTANDDVWLAGSDVGSGAALWHWSGSDWASFDAGAGGLWWGHSFDDGRVLVGGEGGRILRRDGEGAEFVEQSTPGSNTVYGIWGASSDDVWAVGGIEGVSGFAWHWDGSAWNDVALPTEVQSESMFKVWGRGADDLWVVGSGGVILHWDGSAFELESSAVERTLFTVHASATQVVAVGGFASGVILERSEDGTWVDVTPELAGQINGVRVDDAGGGWAVGVNGESYRRVGQGVWEADPESPFVFGGLHSVWMGPGATAASASTWAVGGQLSSTPPTEGVVLHAGPAAPASLTP